MIKRVLAGMAVMMLCAGPLQAAEFPWELKKDEEGVQAYVRKVEGSSILEFKGTMMAYATLEAVVRLFEQEGRMPEWFHQCSDSRMIKVNAPGDEVLYFVMSMPWPVKDRDVVFRRLRSVDPVTHAVEYKTSSVPDVYPEQPGKVRMPSLKGLWRFTPLPGGRIEIYYQQHSEVGGRIPDWLVNKLAVNIPFNSLTRFRLALRFKTVEPPTRPSEVLTTPGLLKAPEAEKAAQNKLDYNLGIENATGKNEEIRASKAKIGVDYQVSDNATIGVEASRKMHDAQDAGAWDKSTKDENQARAKYKIAFD